MFFLIKFLDSIFDVLGRSQNLLGNFFGASRPRKGLQRHQNESQNGSKNKIILSQGEFLLNLDFEQPSDGFA